MKLTREQYTKLDEMIRGEIDGELYNNYALHLEFLEITNRVIDRMIKNIFRILGE